MGQILVAIETSDGSTGYGVGGGGKAGIHVIESLLRPRILGEEERDMATLWERMYREILPFGAKGICAMALSGVDLALWDLQGKREEKSISKLLGKTPEAPLPTYQTIWDVTDQNSVVQGQSYKLHVGPITDADGISKLVDDLELLRSLAGSDAQLMVDAWMKWDLETTLKIAERLAKLSFPIEWIEEPLPIDDRKGYQTLMADSPIPIAGGEHEFTAKGFEQLLEAKLHHVWQPDVCWCGGLTELVKIYELAQQANLRVVPHRGAELWGLHAIAALDENPLAESGRPWMGWVGGQPAIINGHIQVPSRPGFGAEIDEASLTLL